MRRLLPVFAVVFAVWSAWADETPTTHERNRWRVSVGAGIIGGVKANLGVKAGRMVSASGFGSSVGLSAGGRTRDEAYRLGSGQSTTDGKRIFDGGAWYDPNDSGVNDSGYSWNWRLHDPSVYDADFQGFVERTAYSELTGTEVLLHRGSDGDSDEWMPGLRIEAARELYASDGERPWGVDAAVAFAYYFQRDVWDASGTAATAETQGREGYYEWRNDSNGEAHYILDYGRASQFDGSMWGAGTFEGPGAELPNTWSYKDIDTTPAVQTLTYRGSGDYREYAIECLVRPWWEPYGWLRVFGSVGLEFARREFEWSVSAHGSDGSSCAASGDEKDWCVRVLAGGGVEVKWNDYFLFGEALGRFGDDDLDVDGDIVSGSVESARISIRLGLGWSF